jgi:hypothetical protein
MLQVFQFASAEKDQPQYAVKSGPCSSFFEGGNSRFLDFEHGQDQSQDWNAQEPQQGKAELRGSATHNELEPLDD